MVAQLRVAVVGSLGRGRSFLPPLQLHPRAQLVGLCDVATDRLAQQAAELGVPAFDDLPQMLDALRPDALIVATPMHLHVPFALAALERDMHVLSEVPATVGLDEARQLVAAVARSRGQYMMGENVCYMRHAMLLHALAKRGLFGELYYAEGAYIHELKALNEITPWRRRWQTGVNACTYATHSLGPILQCTGARVTSLCAFGSGHHYRDPRGNEYEMEDSVSMCCRLSNGGLANIRVDMLSDRPPNNLYCALQGTDGCYEAPRGLGDTHKIWLRDLHGDDPQWHSLAELEEEFLPEPWRNPPAAALQAGHGGSDFWTLWEFVDAVTAGRAPEWGVHESLDLTLPGLVSEQSLACDSAWLDVPDSRVWQAELA